MSDPLDRIRAYVELTPEEETKLKSHMIEMRFKRGAKLTSSDIKDSVFYIKYGSARFFYITNGKDNTFSFAFDSQFILIPNYFLHIPDAVISIEFLERTEVIAISHQKALSTIRDLHKDHSQSLSLFLLTAMYEYNRFLEERVLMLQTSSALQRYNWLINRHPIIFERATLTQIASFLGITKETLYRIRAGKYPPQQA